MKSPAKRPQNLDEWLDIATRKLASSPKRRIRTEIQAHYQEAVAAHTTQGTSVSDAEAAALAELGDATGAERRFRSSHLTSEEAEMLKLGLMWSRPAWLLAVYSWFTVLQFWRFVGLHQGDKHLASTIVTELLAFVVVPTITFVAARRGSARPNILLLVLMQMVSLYVWAFLSWSATMGVGFDFCLVAPMCVGPALVLWIRLWRKRQAVTDVWSEIPTKVA